MNVQDIVKWLLVIGVFAGAFLAISALVRGWIFGMAIYLAVFVLVTGTALKSEVISFLNLFSCSNSLMQEIDPFHRLR
ncbi:MAG: hypothetical protein BWY58_00949 [Chloroflexi bacterium ADurb.Bin344]|nr:MAG: hypothetical protein BWY58_00949 [Chloroflexi bacterium ADurb.Bin344]